MDGYRFRIDRRSSLGSFNGALMPYAFNGICYSDVDAALGAFTRSGAGLDPTGILTFTAPPSINSTGLVSWSITRQSFQEGATATATYTGVTQLPACSDPSSQFDIGLVLFICALLFAFFNGFKTGFRP